VGTTLRDRTVLHVQFNIKFEVELEVELEVDDVHHGESPPVRRAASLAIGLEPLERR
jgi:hypothetical protein